MGLGYEGRAQRPVSPASSIAASPASAPTVRSLRLSGYDAVVQGMAGLMSVNGEPDGAPVRVGVPVVDLATGMNATIAILMAVIERRARARRQFVEAKLV